MLLVIMVLPLVPVNFCRAQQNGKELSEAEKRQLIQEAEESLNNTEWQIELQQMGKKGKKAEEDTLYFKSGKIFSDKLTSEGFSPSNYTIRVKGIDNDIIIWETMQTDEEKGVAFWRGEVNGEIGEEDIFMRGVLSLRREEGKQQDLTFISTKKKILPKEDKATEQKTSG